jgi:hypothetical protein
MLYVFKTFVSLLSGHASLFRTALFSDFFTLEAETNRLPRNIGKELPLYAA